MAARIELGVTRIISLPGEPRPQPELVGELHPCRKTIAGQIFREQLKQVVNRAGLYPDAAIHIAFRKGKVRIEKQSPLDSGVAEANGHGLVRLVAEIMDLALVVENP